MHERIRVCADCACNRPVFGVININHVKFDSGSCSNNLPWYADLNGVTPAGELDSCGNIFQGFSRFRLTPIGLHQVDAHAALLPCSQKVTPDIHSQHLHGESKLVTFIKPHQLRITENDGVVGNVEKRINVLVMNTQPVPDRQ